MTAPTDRKVKGTLFYYKTTSGGSYAQILGCTARQLPMRDSQLEETTYIESAVLVKKKTIVDWGDLILSILYDPENTEHAALFAACAADHADLFMKVEEPNGRLMEFQAAAYQFGEKNEGPKAYRRNDFKAHCNTEPTFTAPS